MANKKNLKSQRVIPKKKMNAFYGQSGGVTAVINSTACGVIETARKHKNKIGKVFVGRHGIQGLLMEELQKSPAILRLSYLADVEDPKLVERRIKAITGLVNDAWQDLDCCYRLVVEHEVFWRMGRSPDDDPRLSELREAGQ